MQPYRLPTLEEYDAHLATTPSVTEKGRRTFRSSYRRMLRDLYPPECHDPITLHDYRLSMKKGTRNVFDTAWKHLRELEAGREVELARAPSLHRAHVSHPLMHDVLTLTGYLGTDRIAVTTWATVPAWAQNDQVERALERIFEFQTGKPALEITGETPLVPTRHGLPMRPWQLDHVLNGPHHESDHPIDRGARTLAEILVHAGVNGHVLRDYLTLYQRARASLTRGDHAAKLEALLRLAQGRQYPLLRGELLERASEDVPPCW